IIGKVRCALIGSGMAAKWWPEALKYMTAVNNRIPTARLKGKCPYEALYGNKASGTELRIWGSTCYAHVPKTKRANPKLSERAIECKLLGFSDGYKGFRLLDIKGNRFLNARDVQFGVTYTEGLTSKSFPSGTIGLNSDSILEISQLSKRERETGTKSPKKRPRVTNKEEET
ncbi:Retroelement pol Polyprotein, partial [Phytophthora megakarya]